MGNQAVSYARLAPASNGVRGFAGWGKQMRNGTVGLALLFSLWGAGSARAATWTPVTCGDTISVPGNYYLAADCEGPEITITASNVDLDLRGHVLTNRHGKGVSVQGSSNVYIHGGTLDGVYLGVELINATHCRVTSCLVKFGVQDGLYGFLSSGGSDNRFLSCAAFQNPFWGGDYTRTFEIQGSSYNRIIGCYADAGEVGIALDGATNTIVQDNGVGYSQGFFAPFNPPQYAIVDSGGTNNTIANNHASSPILGGILLGGTTGDVVRENNLSGSQSGATVAGGGFNRLLRNTFSSGANAGVSIFSSNNRLEGNTVYGPDYGVFVANGAVGNSIQRNSAHGATYDLFDDNAGPPLPNTWIDNSFDTTNYPGVIH